MNGRMIAIGALALGIGIALFLAGAALAGATADSPLDTGGLMLGSAMFYSGIAIAIAGVVIIVFGVRD